MIVRPDPGRRKAFGSPAGAIPPDSTETATYAAELARRYPRLPPHAAGRLAIMLSRIASAATYHAVRRCNGEATMRGDVPGYGRYVRRVWEHDPEAEQRAGERLRRRAARWLAWLQFWADLPDTAAPAIVLNGDPGYGLEVVWSGRICGHCTGEDGEHGIGCPHAPMPNGLAEVEGAD